MRFLVVVLSALALLQACGPSAGSSSPPASPNGAATEAPASTAAPASTGCSCHAGQGGNETK